MPISVSSKDKRVKAAMAAKPGASVKGLQPKESTAIFMRISALRVADSLKELADAFPNWRIHEWEGREGYWSIDVTGNTRLLFDFNSTTMEAMNMIYDDPH